MASIKKLVDLAANGILRKARTFKEDVKAIQSGESSAAIVNLNEGNLSGRYESGNLNDYLAKKNFYVDDDKFGNVIFGKDKQSVEYLKNAKNPYEYGKAYGYSDADIAKFYETRRRGNEMWQSEFLKDSGQSIQNQSNPTNVLELIKMGRVIDPRVAPKVNDAEKVRNLLYRTETTGVTDPNPVSIFDFEGRPFISGMSDRSQAGETVTNINNVQLDRPVNLEGGQNYMFQNPGLLWANAPTEAKYINDFAQHLRGQTGKDPLYLPWRMGPGSADSSTMTGDVMLSYAQSALGKRDRNAVNKYIKENYIPDWYGLDDPRSIGQWNNLSASKRADFVNKFGNVGNVNQFGGLTTGEARAIVTEPFQYSAPDMRLQNVGLLSGRNVVPSKHSTYKAAVEGEGLGRLVEGDVTPFDLNPTMKAKAGFADYERNVNRANLTGDDRYSLQMNVVGGVITDKVLKNLEKAGVTAAGLATIGAAGAAPPEFLDRIYNPQNHKFIMNDDGTISTHLMAAEMDSDGNWYVFPLIQEDANGNLNDYRNDFDTAMEKAITSGNFLPFGQNKDAALEFSKNYKQGTPLEDYNPMKPTIQQNMESMINTPRRAEVTPMKRNAALGLIADAFKLGKDVLNDMPSVKALVQQAFGDVGFGAEVVGAPGKGPVKVEGTLPIGDNQLGLAPEGYDNLSYGMMPTDEQLLDMGLLALGPIGQIAKPLKLLRKAR